MPAQQHDHPQYHHLQQEWLHTQLQQAYKYLTDQRGLLLVVLVTV
jgi:hypothetical protein